MTRTEAQDIITKAIAAEGPIAGTLSIDAFAARVATALDALGMLQYADVANSAPIEPSGAKSPALDNELPWATQRQRT